MADVPQAELAAVLGILQNACHELAGVREQLANVNLMGQKLENLADGQELMGETLRRLGTQHQESQFKYLEQASKQELKILEINLKIANYNDYVDKVNNMDKKMYVIGTLSVILGALFASLPPWMERLSPQKDTVSLMRTFTGGRV